MSRRSSIAWIGTLILPECCVGRVVRDGYGPSGRACSSGRRRERSRARHGGGRAGDGGSHLGRQLRARQVGSGATCPRSTTWGFGFSSGLCCWLPFSVGRLRRLSRRGWLLGCGVGLLLFCGFVLQTIWAAVRYHRGCPVFSPICTSSWCRSCSDWLPAVGPRRWSGWGSDRDRRSGGAVAVRSDGFRLG